MERDELKKKVEETMRLIQTPIDFDGLIKDGVLAREGSWYRILDPERVPEHVRAQIGEVQIRNGELLFRLGSAKDRSEEGGVEGTG